MNSGSLYLGSFQIHASNVFLCSRHRHIHSDMISPKLVTCILCRNYYADPRQVPFVAHAHSRVAQSDLDSLFAFLLFRLHRWPFRRSNMHSDLSEMRRSPPVPLEREFRIRLHAEWISRVRRHQVQAKSKSLGCHLIGTSLTAAVQSPIADRQMPIVQSTSRIECLQPL